MPSSGSLILLHIVQLVTLASAQYDWSDYPVCAQTYMAEYAPTTCAIGTPGITDGMQENECLCSDTNFLTSAAKAIYSNCGCSDLTTSGSVMVANCDASFATPILNAVQFVMAGDGNEATCKADANTSADPAPSSTLTTQPASTAVQTTFRTSTTVSPTPSSSPSPPSPDPAILAKKSNQIAIAVGVVGILVTTAGVVSSWWWNWFGMWR